MVCDSIAASLRRLRLGAERNALAGDYKFKPVVASETTGQEVGRGGGVGCRKERKLWQHRLILLCMVGIISFLHYFEALRYISLLRELSSPYLNIKSFIIASAFLSREKGVAAIPHSPTSVPGPVGEGGRMTLGIGGVVVQGAGTVGSAGLDIRLREKSVPTPPWAKREENQQGDTVNEKRAEDQLKPQNLSHPAQPAGPDLPEVPLVGKQVVLRNDTFPDPLKSMGDLHTRTHRLEDDKTPYFVRTKAGALCFRQGTEVATPNEYSGKSKGFVANGAGAAGQQKPLAVQQQPSIAPEVKCVCRPGWHGPYCGVPTTVYHSNLPTKERLMPRKTPRRVINAININHEFDLLQIRFRELAPAVDLFLVCESNFTAYGEKRPLTFLRLLLNGTYDYIRHKILYVFLDHFPEGGRQDGWITDDYLRTFLTHNGMSRVVGARSDDVFATEKPERLSALQAQQQQQLQRFASSSPSPPNGAQTHL
ncbi:beta-1,4-mannosyl-glycoprotein 4-beta-N-acetylglucosaminyltransferase-like [Morone saxatilis]|uniref:beta-1,4-mannosyl-glycoprotein 4-beta-N-acetylglucosaminyltransferase-like n=1 Tax=Morone saxatilis TaxID=34816 RepID=UPI0015E22CC5|nr:beta-1,4-mannosyl-glycoprotein 4-beta-N-acetylglucosaminyltransferase-like [Morone saxatilis]